MNASYRKTEAVRKTIPPKRPFPRQGARAFLEEQENCRLFSLRDVEQFAHQLPLLGAVGVLALAPLVCCAGLCLSMGKRGKGRVKALWCLLLAASLAGLFLLLGQVELPPALMPPETIFDLGYYWETFGLLENGLSAFSSSCGELGALLAQQQAVALVIFLGGCITPQKFPLTSKSEAALLCVSPFRPVS